MYYYKDYDFRNLTYGRSIKSHLGTMKKYLPDGIKIQFPKVNPVEISDGVLKIRIYKGTEGYKFIKTLQDKNNEKMSNLRTLQLFNNIEQSVDFQMKINSETLIFNENSELISLEDLVENLHRSRIVVIANTPGLWTTDKSYGNTWTVEQIKAYICVEGCS